MDECVDLLNLRFVAVKRFAREEAYTREKAVFAELKEEGVPGLAERALVPLKARDL